MNKFLIIFAVGILVIGLVYASSVLTWSNPSVGFPKSTPKPQTHYCSNQEWNRYFTNWRNGILTKNETISKLKECNKW